MKRIYAFFTVLSLSSTLSVYAAPPISTVTNEQASVPGELLIQFRPGVSEVAKAKVRARVVAVQKKHVKKGDGVRKGDLELASIPSGAAVEQAIREVEADPAVAFAEPNWIYQHQAASNDPAYTGGSLWGMYGDTTSPANAFGSQAGEVWSLDNTGDRGVVIGVIDEGIDLNHPDLAANIWTNPFDGADGLDNDGNGYIDDVHGWDFNNGDSSIYDGAPGDNSTDSHGTHVAGTVGAQGGNAQGVAGVNWNVSIISGKFLGTNGGTTADAVQAISYFTDLKTRHGLNLVALNNSWGGGGYSQALHDVIIRAAKAQILFVAAAGNNGTSNDSTARYPANYTTLQGTSTETAASYDAVIAVASITSSGARSSFSNYGATTVDLGAPGSGIWSTTPNNTYSSFSGTSMATPHVSGAAALYFSLNPGTTAAAIKTAILDSARATPTASLNGITVTNGRLNVGEFIAPTPPPAAPADPSGLTATAVSSSQINLAWADNATNEDGYKVERCQGSGCTNFVQVVQLGANTAGYSDKGLSAGTTYQYRVHAFNSGGDSGYSNSAGATTQAAVSVPAAPSNLAATAVSTTQIKLNWADNAGNESGYKIERCKGSNCKAFRQIKIVGANTTSFTNGGLARGSTYRYRVRAYNSAGNSPYSNIAQATTRR